MVRFECDNCRNILAENDSWLMGFAAEAIGAVSARREINMVSSWTYDNALQPLAVHFCSERCRDGYVQKLFGELPTVVPQKRVVNRERATPAVAKRALTVVSKRTPAKAKPVRKRKAS